MRLAVLIAALSAGLGQLGTAALASDAALSERDVLDQAVALYEKLYGGEVRIPAALAERAEDETLAKAAVLGFINADELDSIAEGVVLRKQDVMTVLYKTIIDYDDSFALSTEEVDEIMNKCYDNAIIDEENRVGYAFMIKHGVIVDTTDSEPNKEVTWSSCRILVDVLYDLFMQDVSFTAGGTEVRMGANIDTVTELVGEPDRIDKSDYGFDWYVYNSDYAGFMMIGVSEGRICAFCSNGDFSFDGINAGDDYIKIYRYLDDDSYRFFEDKDGGLDTVIYNPHYKDTGLAENSSEIRAAELVDLINANRAKNGLEPLSVSAELWRDASGMAVQPKYAGAATDLVNEHIADGAAHEAGYDICSVYAKLLKNGSDCFSAQTLSVGVGTSVLDDYSVMASVVCASDAAEYTTSAEDIAALPTAEPTAAPIEATAEPVEATAEETAEPTEKPEEVFSTIGSIALSNSGGKSSVPLPETSAEEPAVLTSLSSSAASEPIPETTEETAAPSEAPDPGAPVIAAPKAEEIIGGGEPVVVELGEDGEGEYFVRVYSIEDDEYIVNSYIKTSDGRFELEPALFDEGKDYVISVSAVTEEGVTSDSSVTIGYGTAPFDAVRITKYDAVTDNDFIELEWESDIYHDFAIDIYNADGELILSRIVEDNTSARISGVDPGEYHVYVCAVRRGDSSVVKVHGYEFVTVKLPEPVLTEYILDEGERFYPIYEDKDMGLVYFYDEDIVDVEVPAADGTATSVKRKRITEKEVKATAKYKALADAQQKVEYFEGGEELQIVKPTTVSSITLSDSAEGGAICSEAAKYLGVPYLWGGTTPDGFDCSGFVQYVFKSLGIEISRTTYTQVNEGVPVAKEDLRPGDLVFFGANGNIHHVGIYTGNNTMIHAPYTGAVIRYQSLDTPYYTREYSCARRFTQD